MAEVQQKPCPEHIVKAVQHIAAGGPLCRVLAQALKERVIAEGYDTKGIFLDEDETEAATT